MVGISRARPEAVEVVEFAQVFVLLRVDVGCLIHSDTVWWDWCELYSINSNSSTSCKYQNRNIIRSLADQHSPVISHSTKFLSETVRRFPFPFLENNMLVA